jgi:hypothetical protein
MLASMDPRVVVKAAKIAIDRGLVEPTAAPPTQGEKLERVLQMLAVPKSEARPEGVHLTRCLREAGRAPPSTFATWRWLIPSFTASALRCSNGTSSSHFTLSERAPPRPRAGKN